jgi:hypothetical protein
MDRLYELIRTDLMRTKANDRPLTAREIEQKRQLFVAAANAQCVGKLLDAIGRR